ncbi:MAG: metallophosphoesterase [Bacteroidaceae bacterium]|nr:metallophosphoesterase [Bacteroidaceae bacterium]
MLLRVSLSFILLAIVPALAIYACLPRWRRWWMLAPNLLLLVGTVFLFAAAGFISLEPTVWRTRLLTTVLCVAMPQCVAALFMLFGLLFRRANPSVRRFFNGVGIAGAATVFFTLVYGITTGSERFVRKEYLVADERIPAAFDGYRIAVVSDLHVGTHTADTAAVGRMVDFVNATRADLVCFVGDAVNFSDRELDEFMPQLSRLCAPDGVVSVMGNHDYLLYYAWPDSACQAAHIARLQQAEHTLGWQLLLNKHTVVRRGADSLVIAGVENDSKRADLPRLADLSRALQGVNGTPYTVLLTHDPTHWRRGVVGQMDIPLTFSGHTHGMQFSLFGWSPAALVYDEWGGRYTAGRQTLIVTTGLGSSLVPFRLGAWPEVAVCTLRHVDR